MAGAELLKKTELFNTLPADILQALWQALRPRTLEAGEILFNMGEPGDELIVIESGKLSIFTPPSRPEEPVKPIRIFVAGETVGEMALIDHKPRSLSARAEESCQILTLNGVQFRRLLELHPEMGLAVMANLSERIRYTTQFLHEVRRWVQRIAEGNYQSIPTSNAGYADSALSSLAAEFAQMTAKVQQREETLRQELVQLRIEIDEAKRKREADTIMQSDYYQSLKERVKKMRQQKEDLDSE